MVGSWVSGNILFLKLNARYINMREKSLCVILLNFTYDLCTFLFSYTQLRFFTM